MGLGYFLKKKRDAENRVQRSDPNKSAVFVEGKGFSIPSKDLEAHVNAADPHTQYALKSASLKKFQQEFNNLLDWDVVHNLGDDPAITIWKYDGAFGFGIQPFGTTGFGGSKGTVKVDMTPTITRLDANSLRVSWLAATYGKVVTIGDY